MASTLTLRLSARDAAVVEAAKAATASPTATRALIECAASYPDLRAELDATRAELAKARAELERVRLAIRRWRGARGAADAAAAELGALG